MHRCLSGMVAGASGLLNGLVIVGFAILALHKAGVF